MFNKRLLLKEGKLISKCNHPYIKCFELINDPKLGPLLLLEFCPYRDLKKYREAQKKQINEEKINIWITQILLGLQYLRKHGVIIRDIKSENILLRKNGNVAIADFGVAKGERSGAHTSSSISQTVVGTPGKMAPEMERLQKKTTRIVVRFTGAK